MKAKINPGNFNWTGKKQSEIAIIYGLSINDFKRHAIDFLQSEGFDKDSNEYDDLHDWLVADHKPYVDNTPWQKGDDWDI
ncbi:MAG: hypothetical protein KKD77_21965 [Gammaproteobacteria bacterium]|nr:hypothetical protein [Gammaproteobacteria bacterium]MBU2249429.1 hypothetical protein [Gammaproteobacteria bacterium]MBU2685615.1 hypothetical protein [Gammaproteobacteria bacterium]